MVGPGQTRILARARSLGIKTFKTYTRGAQVFEYLGQQSHFTGLIPPLPPADGADFAAMLAKLVALESTVPLDRPWTAPNALALDGQTLETWKLANTSTPGARFLLDLVTESVFAAEPRDLSLLHALFYYHSGNGVINLSSTAGGAQDSRLVGGSQLISIRMAERLGKRVVLNAPARRIEHAGRGVTVTTDAGTWRGKAVIVAMAPTLAGRIDYDPPLSAQRDQLTQRVPQGSAIKYRPSTPRRSGGPRGSAATATATARRSASPTTTRHRAARPACSWGLPPARTPGGSAPRAPAPGAGRCWPPSRACSGQRRHTRSR